MMIMNCDISELMLKNDDQNLSMICQLLTNFIMKINYYHIQSIQGLVCFDDEIYFRIPFSPLMESFDLNRLRLIASQNSKPKLWDSHNMERLINIYILNRFYIVTLNQVMFYLMIICSLK